MCVCVCVWVVAAGEQFHPYLQVFRQSRPFNTGFILFMALPPSLSPLQVSLASNSDFWNFPQTIIVDDIFKNELKLNAGAVGLGESEFA